MYIGQHTCKVASLLLLHINAYIQSVTYRNNTKNCYWLGHVGEVIDGPLIKVSFPTVRHWVLFLAVFVSMSLGKWLSK